MTGAAALFQALGGGCQQRSTRLWHHRAHQNTSLEVSMLINCVAYENGAKLADISVADISDHIVRPGCFVWVALADATPAELDEMREEFGLHELAVEDAQHGHQRPKIEEYGPSLFVVMHLLEPEAGRP